MTVIELVLPGFARVPAGRTYPIVPRQFAGLVMGRWLINSPYRMLIYQAPVFYNQNIGAFNIYIFKKYPLK